MEEARSVRVRDVNGRTTLEAGYVCAVGQKERLLQMQKTSEVLEVAGASREMERRKKHRRADAE